MDKAIYYCQCKGCPNGCGSAFEAAPPEWFYNKGMTPPKNCPDCRAWIKAQYDESLRCQSCNRPIRVPARAKISHHKRTGVYETPRECRRCESGKKPPTSSKQWQHSTLEELLEESGFDALPVKRWPQIYPLDINPNNYDHVINSKGQTRREHIEAHTDWSEHTDTKLNGGKKSPSALGLGQLSFESMLRSTNLVTQSQVAERVREYVDAQYGRVIRVTLTDSARIEVTIIEAQPGTYGHQGHELVSTYDNFTIAKVMAKLNTREWL